MANKPIAMIRSYPPRLCGIGTFCEEAREFIQKANPDRTARRFGIGVLNRRKGKKT